MLPAAACCLGSSSSFTRFLSILTDGLKQFISNYIAYSEQPQTLTMEDMQLHDGLEVGESGRRPLSCLFIVEVITSS